MIVIEHGQESYFTIRASGTLTKTDYEAAIPEIEHAMKLAHGKPRVLILLEDFQGFEAGALWEELRFDMKHYGDFGRVAVVGEDDMEKWAVTLSKPFAGSVMQYFSRTQMEDAKAWLTAEG